MARIRTIKPEFWTDAKTGTLSEIAKCLLLGLLNHADDYGVLAWSPIEWRAKILPYHSDTTTGTVNGCLVDELLPRGLVVLFALTDDDGETRKYAFIKNFARHQVINKPSKPLLQGWKIADTPETYAKRFNIEHQNVGPSGIDGSGSTPVALPPGKERKGKEEEGKGKDSATPTRDDASPSPLDFKKELWARGVSFLKANGLTERDARSMLGRWRKTHTDLEVLNALAAAEGAAVSEPIPYIAAVLSQKGKPNGSGQHGAPSLATQVFGGGYAAARAERERGS